MFRYLYILGFCSVVGTTFAQNDSLKIVQTKPILSNQALDPLAPSKAAFYSTVVPGLGQYYNKSYWKIPVIYAGIGASTYFYFDNSKKYTKARDEYKLRLRGIERTDTPKLGRYTKEQLATVQKTAQKNRDLSLFIALGVYILNIVDANVDAHLQQFNVDEDLTFKPTFEYNSQIQQHQFGVNMTIKF